jgi:hypothetical protein
MSLRVEVDDSNCIVIVRPRLDGPDVRLTVTNVAQLKWDLDQAVTQVAMNEDRDPGGTP